MATTTFDTGTVITSEFLNDVQDAEHLSYTPTGAGAVATTVQAKLREIVSVKDYGAVGDGSTDDTTAIQAAIDCAYSSGGGSVFFESGTYRIQNLKAKNRVKCVGVFGATILKVVDGVDKQVFYNPDQAVPTTVDYFGLEGLILDGNKSADAGVAAVSACAINGVTYFYAKDCVFQNATGYGLAFQAYPGTAYTGEQTKIYLENCHFLNNGDGVGGDTFDGLDIKDSYSVTLIGCHAIGNSDRGFNIRGDNVNLFGCYAQGNGLTGSPGLTAGFEIVGNSDPATVSTTARLIACESRLNGGAGFSFADGNGSATKLVMVNLTGCMSFGNGTHGLETQAGSSLVELTATGLTSESNASHGVSLHTSTRSAQISGRMRSNGGSGIYTNMIRAQLNTVECVSNTSYGIEEGASATRTIVSGSSVITSNTVGNFLWNANGRRHIGQGVVDYDSGSTDGIASAATITLPEGGDVFFVTGTTDITSITASRRGRVVVLLFNSILTVDEGAGNLALAGDFTTSSSDTLTIMCDGTNWLEVSRSVN